jgi:pimeloyl-ACP methyl ester carboxylesterase
MQVLVNNLTINFQVYGSGSPIIVLHGWGDKSDSWYNFAQALANKYQVFLVDLPGFGGSDAPPAVWGVKDYANAINGFIKELDIENPVLLGHSHGGRIISTIAADDHNCRALVLVGSGGVDMPSLKVKLKIRWFKTIKLLARPFGKKGDEIINNYRKKLGSRDYQDAGPLQATMVKVVNYKLFNILPKIKVPTLIIWGSEDKTLSYDQSKIFEKLISDSYIKIIWGGGHHLHLDSAQELADIVKDFLSELEISNQIHSLVSK